MVHPMMVAKAIACVALILLSACASDPTQQRLSEHSKGKALFLLTMSRSQVPYSVALEAIDESTGELRAGPVSGWAEFQADPDRYYVSERVTPGTYVFTHLTQQGRWSACFQDNTLALDVKDGEVVYLGEIHPERGLAALQAEAENEKKTTARYFDQIWLFDNIPSPVVDFPGGKDKALMATQSFVKSKMPNVTAPTRLAEYRPSKFSTGSTLGKRICTAY